MRYISTEKLMAGMMVSLHFYDEEKNQLLMSGQILTDEIINELKKNKFEGLYVEDIQPQKACQKFWNKVRDYNTTKEIDEFLKIAKRYVNKTIEGLRNDLGKIKTFDKGLYRHSISVANYSAGIGLALGYNEYHLEKLISAALLHDIGKIFVSKRIWNKNGPLTEEEREEVNNHPVYGYYFLKDRYKPSISLSVYQHHENIDGSGYPNHEIEENIHPFARIIHVADVYDALVSKRSYKDEVSTFKTHNYLNINAGKMFDKDVLKALYLSIPIFPIGEKVVLSNKENATVVKNNKDMQMYPIVKMSDGTVVDLSKTDISIMT